MENIPVEILTESLKEMIEGRDAGVKAWSFDNHPIEDEMIEKFNIGFKRYYLAISTDCKSLDNSAPRHFNPDINEFTKLFVDDAVYLMESESNTSISELERTALSHIVADIPITIFTELSKKSLEYVR